MYNYGDECIMCGEYINNQHNMCSKCRNNMANGIRLDAQFASALPSDFRKSATPLDTDDSHDFYSVPLTSFKDLPFTEYKKEGNLIVKIERGCDDPIPFNLDELEKNPNVTVVYIPKGQLHVNIAECFLCGNLLKSHPTVCDGCVENAKSQGIDPKELEKIM